MPSLLTTYATLSLLLPLIYCGTSREGSISLWSDSECNSKGTTSHFSEPDPIGLNFKLWPDYCGIPGAAVHSYKINEQAICVNGTSARFTYYDSENCTPEPTDENPNPTLSPMVRPRQMGGSRGGGLDIGPGSDLTGLCLALTAFKSFAFVCEGVDDDGFKSVQAGAAAAATTSSPSSIASSTPGASSTPPPSSTPAGSSTTAASSTSPASSSSASPESNGSSSTASTSAVASGTSTDSARVVTTAGPTVTVVAGQSSNQSPDSAVAPSATPSSQPSAGAQSSESSSGASAGIKIGCAVGVLGAAALLFV